MADPSTLARSLANLVTSAGWEASARRFTLDVVEPAFEPVTHTWLAGQARSITDEEIMRSRPSRIVLEDGAPLDHFDRIEELISASGLGTRISSYSHFVDEFWGAGKALSRALHDAESSDTDFDLDSTGLDVQERHVEQVLDFDSGAHVTDHRAFEFGLPDNGTCLAILADAGLGKTELLRWQEWRHAVTYTAALRAPRNVGLPPIALRLPLRGLRSLSMDYIAHALSQPTAENTDSRLRMVSSGRMLRELLVQHRLILFLDGLDELAVDPSGLDSGLLEWRRAVAEGARVVVTSRAGLATISGAITRRFSTDEVARLRPMNASAARELLEKRGTRSDRARDLVTVLQHPANSIPLFVLLAKAVELQAEEQLPATKSRTFVLRKLLELFCERDSKRLLIGGDQQMELLTSIAEWLLIDDTLEVPQLLENLGIDSADVESRVLTNPHSLLTLSGETVGFKFPELGAFFTARAIDSGWQLFGFDSIAPALRSRKLDHDVIEFAARLLPQGSIAEGWSASLRLSDSPLLARRNILALALAALDDSHAGESEQARSVRLSEILGSHQICQVSLSGVHFTRIELSQWTFEKVSSRDGYFSYCPNLWRAQADSSLRDAVLEGCSFDEPVAPSLNLEIGIERLRDLVKPLRRRNGRGITSMMAVDEARDRAAWQALEHLGFVTKSGRGTDTNWTLSQAAVLALSAFSLASLSSRSDLDRVVENNDLVASIVKTLSS